MSIRSRIFASTNVIYSVTNTSLKSEKLIKHQCSHLASRNRVGKHNWIDLAQNRDKWQKFENTVLKLHVP
jgi:hypothetical protein